jgi:hypothetical protein
MKFENLRSRLAVALLAGLFVLAPKAGATVVMNVTQVGADVFASGSGTLNITSLTNPNNASGAPFVQGAQGNLIIGLLPNNQWQNWQGSVTGPTSFGTLLGAVLADVTTGDHFGIRAQFLQVATPLGYVSGSPLSATATWNNRTLAGLGLIEGTYVWTWGTGLNADSFTLNIGTPEPGSWLLLGTGIVALVGLRRRV